MTDTLKYMSGDEFVAKLLAGERDFRKIKLEHGYQLPPGFKTKQNSIYDLTHDFYDDLVRDYGVDLSDSDLSGFKAVDYLFLPFIKAVGTDFKYATICGAQFHRGDLRKANFQGADLSGDLSQTNLAGANFFRAKLDSTSFRLANLIGVNFHEAVLHYADLRDYNTLMFAKGLDSAHFFETKINIDDKAMFAKIIKKRKFFRF